MTALDILFVGGVLAVSLLIILLLLALFVRGGH